MSELLNFIIQKKHHQYRIDIDVNLAEEYAQKNLAPIARMADRFCRMASLETPVILPREKIVFLRTVKKLPDIFTKAEWDDIKSRHFIHELGFVSNVSPDYASIISRGLLAVRESSNPYQQSEIDALLDLSNRYRDKAMEQGRMDIVNVLERVPAYGATNLREALQFFRILHYSLWLEGEYHNTAGRFDKYMYPYLKADLDNGTLTKDTALELLEDFFISFNKDSDLYPGVQQGDNGQSLVLGGIDENGKEVFNQLSELCLTASRNLKLIDPKINLRVGSNTDISVFELGSQLTKAGLGFPQYSNDDVVIDGLVKLGYTLEDARNYAIAACWEFIIPKAGADVANIGALSFPKVIDTVIRKHLPSIASFDELMEKMKTEIIAGCDNIAGKIKDLWFIPAPFLSLLMDCKHDISEGSKYNYFGIHGTGLSTAADSLAAIKKHIFEEKSISPEEMLEAIDSDFNMNSDILPILRYNSPKMGNNDDFVDSIGVRLLDMFSDALEGRINLRGGGYRAGTGSAMFYIWHANEIGASPDGRRKGEAFGANFSPSLFSKVYGPISIIKSFTKPDLSRVINGGPLTMEFHSSMFIDTDSVKKVARLVKSFIDMGGHQMQLNAVSTEAMHDAQLHPEKYPHLVVRVWGWSAYFVELDREFQDHVIARQEYRV